MKLLSLVFLGLAGLVGWFMWVPVLGFLISIVPPNAEYAWVGKLVAVWLVACFGGIVIPLCFIAIACAILLEEY